MIQIRNTPAPDAALAPRTVAEPAAPDAHATAANAERGGTTDPLARFGAMHGFHSGVALYGGTTTGTSPNACKQGTAQTVYDVGTIKQATIDAMKDSTDPATRKLGITIDNVKKAYGDLKGATIKVLTSAGNGGEPVVVMTGPNFDPAKKARVVTFYHGDNATVGDPVGSKAGINTRVRDAFVKEPQTVFVLPEAQRLDKQPWHEGVDSPQARDRNDYFASWRHVRSQAQTTDDALAALCIAKDRVATEIVAVHSRGGSAISQLMKLDPKGNLLRANRLELYDSLYGSQHDVARWGTTANGKAVGSVIYYRGTNDLGADAAIASRFRDKYAKIDMGGKLIGVPKNEIYRDGDGNTVPRDYHWVDKAGNKRVRHDVVRDFHENPHYKTTGQFLGRNPGLNVI